MITPEPTVLPPSRIAKRYGGVSVKVLPNGVIDLEDLKSKITDEVQLISVSLANNELGVIQPLSEIASIIREVRMERYKRGVKTQLLLHSDASHEARLSPLTLGGGQENGLRSGTENVPGVIGFAKAVELAKDHLNGNRKKYAAWRRILLDGMEDYELINKKHTLDNFVVLCYPGLDAERLIYLLEEREVYVSTGAACAASKGVKSHVLKAIGLTDEQIAGSLRLTFGETNDEEQIHAAAQIINEVVAKERDRIKR